MKVPYPHSLTIAEARTRLGGFLFALKRQYGQRVAESSEAWDGDTLVYSILGIAGRRIRGTVTISEGVVTVEALGDIPSMWEGRVERQIKAALAEALGS